MRRVTQSEFVRLAVEKAAKDFPSFQAAWDQGVMWELRRARLDEAVLITSSSPPTYVLEFSGWRQAGLPVMRIAYVLRDDGIEIIRLA